MKTITCAIAFLFVSYAAFAQAPPPQPSFVPFTVEQVDYTKLQEFLVEQPFKIANPLLQWLSQKEQAALTAEQIKKPAAHQPAFGPGASPAPPSAPAPASQ